MTNESNSIVTSTPNTPSRSDFALKYALATAIAHAALFTEYVCLPYGLLQSIPLIGLYYGTTLGIFQWIVLRNHAAHILVSADFRNTKEGDRQVRETSLWVVACIIGISVAMVLLPIVKRHFMPMSKPQSLSMIYATIIDDILDVQMNTTQVAASSFLLGLPFSLLLWIFLRRRLPRAGRVYSWAAQWIAHNVIGIAAGLLIIKNIDCGLYPFYKYFLSLSPLFEYIAGFFIFGLVVGIFQGLYMFRFEPLFKKHFIDEVKSLPTSIV